MRLDHFKLPVASARLALALTWATLSAGLSAADTVSIRPADASANSAPTVYSDVRVTSVETGKIVFQTQNGHNVVKDLSSVVDLTLDDEPNFNQAQIDYAGNHLDRAVDEYDQTIQKTDKAWLKAFCLPRMTDAADKSGQFDKAAQGYAMLVLGNPALAAQHRPAVPQFGSQYLDAAAATVSAAVDTANITPEQQTALLAFLLEIQRARRDSAAIDAVASRLTGNPTSGGAASDLAATALADAKISEARNAISQQRYDDAINLIQTSRQYFVDTPHQADALYLLAQGRQGQAEAANKPDTWKDAAIAYLRVVADFKNSPGAPHVPDALLHAAGILQRLNQPDKASQMYQSILDAYPSAPAATQARTQLEKLKAAAKS
jgi:TolA-binding protein